jgi:hypothetical protein
MALSAQSVHSLHPAHSTLQPANKLDIHGVGRGACGNCTECPQFVSVPGHVLCAYCGCPPARHARTEGPRPAPPSPPGGQRKRGRPRDSSQESAGPASDNDSDSDRTDSDETSSGVSSFASGRASRRRKWRPAWQVTAPPPRVSRLLEEDPVGRDEQLEHAWNEDDSSPNIFVKPEDLLTFHRNPVYQTSDAIRGRGGAGEAGEGPGYRAGLHVWAVTWPLASRGTHPVVGVATRDCALTEPGYKRLVGSNSSSWGW